MRLYFFFVVIKLSFQAAFLSNADEELSELPFNVDEFPLFLDDPAKTDQFALENEIEPKINTADDHLIDTPGPPGIGLDIFDKKPSEDNEKGTFFEGSGVGFEDISMKTEHLNEIPTPSSILPRIAYPDDTNDNGAIVEKSVTENTNSSVLLDANTSDLEVEPKSEEEGETRIMVEAELEATSKMKKPETIGDIGQIVTRLNVVDKITDKGCPPPRFCGKNCFISINEDGCQDCQCLWKSSTCQSDRDCKQKNQLCDLGKCNCQPGYRQNMKMSGVCEVDPNSKLSNFELAKNAIQDRHLNLKDISKQIESHRRLHKREAKPRRAERLEWPGRLRRYGDW